jgi:hypothetical protein
MLGSIEPSIPHGLSPPSFSGNPHHAEGTTGAGSVLADGFEAGDTTASTTNQ